MEEEYKIIDGFSNYAISNFGNVINIKTGRILKQCLNTNRYKYVSISGDKNSKKFSKQIHRLIAEHFIPNPNNKDNIDHIDNNKQNNYIKNLRWSSSSENCRNSSLSKRNTSGCKGVSFIKKRNKWQAQIMHNHKTIHLGLFDDKINAIKARINKSKELFGEYMNKCENIDIEQFELDELDKELTRLINS